MLKTRVIPVLLLKDGGLVKTLKFEKPKYLGDPINAVKIFNEKEVDELVLLDISATLERREPNYDLIRDIASECFMPLSYGGGITELEQIRRLLEIGIEKVVLNTAALVKPNFVADAAKAFGSSTIVVSVDVRKNIWGKYEVFSKSGTLNSKETPVDVARKMESMGAGEIFLNAIDRDGTMSGYDITLIRAVSGGVMLPVVACGGAGGLNDFKVAVEEGKASAVAAGSMFVFHGVHRAVLISYPSPQELKSVLG